MWLQYSILFFLCSPGVVLRLLQGAKCAAAYPVSLVDVVLYTILFSLFVCFLKKRCEAVDPAFPAEAFQRRGQVGDVRTEGRRRERGANPIRTCATDDDCKDNRTRKFCSGGVCKV